MWTSAFGSFTLLIMFANASLYAEVVTGLIHKSLRGVVAGFSLTTRVDIVKMDEEMGEDWCGNL